MKNLLIIFATAFLFNSCDKDLFQGSDQLPAATQTGARTVGCLVNGKVFLPHKEGVNSPVNCFYQPDENGNYYFNMAFTDLRNGSSINVVIQTRKIFLKIGQKYELNKNVIDDLDFIGGTGIYAPNGIRFYTTLNKIGELFITNLDFSKGIISGTFWFDAINSKGEKVEIRDGRFDWGFN